MGSQDQSSPPSWAQGLMQQIAQSCATQSEATQRQEERIARLEELLAQQSITADTPIEGTDTTTSPYGPNEESTYREEKPSVRRPKARLTDPRMFNGSTSEWPTWKLTMESKLLVDGSAIGTNRDRFLYVFMRLEGLAAKNVTAFVKHSDQNCTPEDLLKYLEGIYGDPNARSRAVRRLWTIRQRDDQSFQRFLSQLERELAESGAISWADEAKCQILLNAINPSMKQSLSYRGVPETYQDLVIRLHQIHTDDNTLGLKEKPSKIAAEARTNRSRTDDEMDWTPTKSAPLYIRRAQWVDQEEIERRRRDKRCIRCGKKGCWSTKCPYSPPRLRSETDASTRSPDRNDDEKPPKRSTYAKKSKTKREEVIETTSESESPNDDSEKE